MPRGGKRTPPPNTPPGGPGRFSRRTDGQQIATPGLGKPGPGGESSLQYGDVQRLRASQQIAPLPSGTPTPRPARQPQGLPTDRGATIPEHLLTMPSETGEPTTSGLDIGPGPGSEVLDARAPLPDIREQVLEYLYLRYQNEDAFAMLNQLRAGRAPQVTPVEAPATPTLPQEPVAPEPEA